MTTSFRHAAISVVMVCALGMGCASGGPHAKPADRSTLTADDIAEHSGDPIEVILQKKFPGLEVLRTANGTLAFRIRGASSLDGNTAPLYVIDGLPVEPGPGGGLIGVDPYNIETVKVVKGAEAAIYGIRGLNGVIVMTTKKHGK